MALQLRTKSRATSVMGLLGLALSSLINPTDADREPSP